MNQRDLSNRLDRVWSATDLDELESTYDQWAADYESDVLQLGYMLRAVSLGYIGRLISPENDTLDAGAGTGLIGSFLKLMGYQHLTAIDLSEKMLGYARQKDCYRALHRMVLGEPLDFATDRFDAAYSIGVFTEGHAPPESFNEIVRVVRPGGHFVFSIRDDVYRERGYREVQDELEHAGKWQNVAASPTFQPYPGSKPEIRSRVFAYKVN